MANVNIHNKLPQTLSVGIKDGSGTLQEVKIPPNGIHGPVDENDVGTYTNQLAKLGHVRIRTAS